MYRPSIDSRLKCYDPPGTGSQNKLKAALKKLFCDICETLISFQHKLEISGTIGITIDSESVLLLQFSEAFLNRSNTTPAFHDHDDDDVNCTEMTNTTGTSMKILHENNWTFASDLNVKQSDRERHQAPCCRNSSSNIKLTDGDVPADNISKNSSGSNLANSSDSNDCTIGFSHFGGRPPTSNGALNAKSELSLDSTGNGCDVSEMRPPRRNSSMLSQLLQRPPSNADVFGSVLSHVWPAPVSASEMLKKMSSRVDSIGNEKVLGSEAKASDGTKPELATSSLAQEKTSPGSSYLRELLFQKTTGHQGQKANSQRAASERKRKKIRHETGSFMAEIDREENSQCSNQHNPHLQCPTANSKDSGSFSRGHFFPDNRTGSSPNSNPEFSEYRYSMLLHKLVDVRRNQHVDSSPSGNSMQNSIASRAENENQGPHADRSSRFEGDPLVSDLWSQEIKVELADRELLESPKTIMKFDAVNHMTENNQEDSDAY